MESRPFQICVRFIWAALVAAYWLVVCRFTVLLLLNMFDKPRAGWPAGKAPSFGNLTTDTSMWIFGHMTGTLVAVALVFIGAGVICLVDWIINGPSKDEDPCKDNENCPCPRHQAEKLAAEKAARNTRTALYAAGVAAVTAAIFSS